MPIANYKCGIDVLFSGIEGTAYAEEYHYYNLPIYDNKTVWIKDTTLIGMGHNVNNSAVTISRTRNIVGTGVGGSGGLIRYAFDKMWSRLNWSASTTPYVYSGYTGTFNIQSQFYEPGIPVVGTTGGTTGGNHSANLANKDQVTGFYWRGMIDSVGDEWHIFKYADDDFYDFPNADGDVTASDGKWFTMVVNPKTPCLSITTGITGQYYTTPPYVYEMPVIRDTQTTYFQGNVNFNLRDIYGSGVFYQINSGGFVNGGSSSITLTQSNFNSGQNTLDYFCSGHSGFRRTRNLVKNPQFPSAGENHGNLLWGTAAEYTKVTGRLGLYPYSGTYPPFNNRNFYGIDQSTWDLNVGSGYRLGGREGVAAWPAGPAATNAFQAKVLGYNAVCAGSVKSYADYAKEMMIENGWCTPNLGFENQMSTFPQASAELNYRGYWDVQIMYNIITAYDILIAEYRSDQYPNGVTPIQDYFVRDRMADFIHYGAMWLGDFQDLGGPGLWGTARNVGAMMAAYAMPSYSTPYYGTCGLDGKTSVYQWAPYKTNNYTWQQLFMTGNYPLTIYPQGPVYNFGWEGVNDGSYAIDPSGQMVTKVDYYGDGQMGYSLAIYKNLQAMYSPTVAHPYTDLYLNNATIGTAYYLVATQGDTGAPPYGPVRLTSVGCLNSRFPNLCTNAQAYASALPKDDIHDNSTYQGVNALDLYGLVFYDYLASGNGASLVLKRWGRNPRFVGLG